MGLFAEVTVLKEFLLEAVSPRQAVESWGGPLHAAQDFTLGANALEVKAIGSEGASDIVVNSEHQLDPTGLDSLHLCAHAIRAITEGDSGRTLNELCDQVTQRLE